ncbi:IS3 family transposase [Bradyrhizobium sp. CCBAU 21362]|uniref:IS3 family transposase n=1 Tax=Bradyrhizobium sp. CCBAU 21362 TaxID=1325082 RepID=UPI003FA4687B
MESFFHTLKTKRVHHRQYATRAETRRHIFAYIEASRLHSIICIPAHRHGAKSNLTLSTSFVRKSWFLAWSFRSASVG